MIMESFENNENMDMNHAILNYFTHRKIVDTLARYDLYYNISILYIAHSIIEDSNEAEKVLNELNLQINPETVFETMYHILKEYHGDEHLFSIFEENIKIQSMLKALDDFTASYDNIKKLDDFIQTTQSKIIMDQFFDEQMDKQFHDALKESDEFWEKIIDFKTAEQILHAMQNMEFEY